jgi:hypothetical protein
MSNQTKGQRRSGEDITGKAAKQLGRSIRTRATHCVEGRKDGARQLQTAPEGEISS